MPISMMANEVRIAVGMGYDEAVRLIKGHSGKDITSGLEVVGPNGEWPLQGILWEFRDFDAILTLSGKSGKVAWMSFWSKADFWENKVHRLKTERRISAITLDIKTKKVEVEKNGQPAPSEHSRASNNVGHSQPEKLPPIRTKFEANAELTAREVSEVISLARQCGISQPAEVRTFYFLPAGGRGVEVKSMERINGADVAFDELRIRKGGWTDIEASGNVKRVGGFWAEPSGKFTRHFRVQDFRGERIRVDIGAGITDELADKVIALIAAKKVRFPSNDRALDFQRRELEEMVGLKPSGLSKQDDGKLWLHFVGRLDALEFRFEKGQVILEQVIRIVI